MDRRKFLETNARLLALSLMPPGLLLSCTRKEEREPLGLLVAPSHVLSPDGKGTVFSLYDLDRDILKEMTMPLETGHVAISHPRNRSLVVVPESAGTRACVIDLNRMAVIKELKSTKGRWFGGHGEFSRDGSLLYISEFEPPPSGRGYLTVLDGADFSPLRSHPSGGSYPHDVSISPDEQFVHISNLGVESGPKVKSSGIHVSRFRAADEKLVERLELNDDAKMMDGHPILASDSALSINDEVIKGDARYFISYMEVAKPQFEIFIYPHSHEPIVNIWNIRQKRLIREFRFQEQPVALTLLTNRKILAVALASGKIELIDVKKYEIRSTAQLSQRMKVTTHVNALKLGGPPA